MSGLTIFFALLVVTVVARWYLATDLWTRMLLRLGRQRAGIESRTVQVDGIRWHYLAGGKGPTLLLLHGFGADTSCWLPLATIIRPRFSLLIPDLPGFGASEPPQKLHFDVETQVLRLGNFLDELGVNKCLVAGNSMGGYLATALAAREPSRVRGLWLLAPLGVNAVPPGNELEAIDTGKVQAGQVYSVQQFRQQVLPTMFSRKRWLPYPLLRSLAKSAISRRDVVPRMLAEVRFESETLESFATGVRKPVLIQWGQNDQIVNPAGLAILEAAFPDATGVITKDCGHLPMLERPRESARLFLDFLNEKRLA